MMEVEVSGHGPAKIVGEKKLEKEREVRETAFVLFIYIERWGKALRKESFKSVF